LNDWLNQFDREMDTFTALGETWLEEINNVGPIADWRLSDIPGGEEA
jgi:hypothetical protein